MILVDTNVWISFFRGEARVRLLQDLLLENQVVMHPYVLLELQLGNVNRHKTLIHNLEQLRSLAIENVSDLSAFIEQNKIHNKGIGLVDLALLYSALLNDCQLWTLDKKLHELAVVYQINY